MPPATIAAEAAFLATRLSFDGTLGDDFLLGFADVLGFFDLAGLDLAPARREEGLTLARLAVFFMTPPIRSWLPATRLHHITVDEQVCRQSRPVRTDCQRPAACPCVLAWA
jgi:hypothetical protein